MTQHHDQHHGGRARRLAIAAVGLGGIASVGFVLAGGSAASAQDCRPDDYYCETTTTVKATTTAKPTTTTVKPTTTTAKPTTTEAPTTTVESTTTSVEESTSTSEATTTVAPTVSVPVSVESESLARPAGAVAAEVAFAG